MMDEGPHPVVFYCTIFAWVCATIAMWLVFRVDSWWVVLPVLGLFCVSLVLSLCVDINRLGSWSRE